MNQGRKNPTSNSEDTLSIMPSCLAFVWHLSDMKLHWATGSHLTPSAQSSNWGYRHQKASKFAPDSENCTLNTFTKCQPIVSYLLFWGLGLIFYTKTRLWTAQKPRHHFYLDWSLVHAEWFMNGNTETPRTMLFSRLTCFFPSRQHRYPDSALQYNATQVQQISWKGTKKEQVPWQEDALP